MEEPLQEGHEAVIQVRNSIQKALWVSESTHEGLLKQSAITKAIDAVQTSCMPFSGRDPCSHYAARLLQTESFPTLAPQETMLTVAGNGLLWFQ